MKIAIILGVFCLIFIGCVTEEVHHEPHVYPEPPHTYPEPDPEPPHTYPEPYPDPQPQPYPPHNETPTEQSGKEFFDESNNGNYNNNTSYNNNDNYNNDTSYNNNDNYNNNDSYNNTTEDKTADDWLNDSGQVEEEVSGKDAFDNRSQDLSEPEKNNGPTDPIDDFMDDGRVEEETSGDDFFNSDY